MEPREERLSFEIALVFLERPHQVRSIAEERGLSEEELGRLCLRTVHTALAEEHESLSAEHLKMLARVCRAYPRLRLLCNSVYGQVVDHLTDTGPLSERRAL